MTASRADLLDRLAELPAAGTAKRHAPAVGSAAWLVRSGRPVPRWAVVSAGLSPVLLTGGWLIAGAFQPASYSPIRETVSVLAGHAGTDRWIMTSALFLVGGCYFVTAAGLTGVRLPARILLVVAGLSSIGIAASPEPVVGSTPQHLAWTSLGEVTIAVWPAFTGRRGSPRPLILSIRGAATVTAVSIALFGWLVIETQGGSDLGLAERLTSSVQITWPFIVALALRRPPRPALPGAQSRPPRPEHGPGNASRDHRPQADRRGRRLQAGPVKTRAGNRDLPSRAWPAVPVTPNCGQPGGQAGWRSSGLPRADCTGRHDERDSARPVNSPDGV